MIGKLIPERLIETRKKLGITKTEASAKLDMSKMGYGRYENGQREPSPQTIEFMSYRLGTTPEYLTGISDDPRPDYFLVSQKTDPELYELITLLQDSDSTILKRLTFYYKKISSETTGSGNGGL